MDSAEETSASLQENPGWTDKNGLASYYEVGVRTIEQWMSSKIILARRNGRKVEFEIADCDRHLLSRNLEKN